MLSTPEDKGLQELPVRALQAGMYVAAIDRPWEQTPFALQGFYVHTEKDIRLVSEHCNHVFVDPRRRLSTSSSSAQSARAADGPVRNAPLAILPHDFKQARADIESADAAISKVFVHLRRSGRLDVRALRSAIDPLVKGVLRDSVAMAALVRIRRRGEYLYHHSLANAVWAAVLGRHLGMSPSDIGTLALGASLVDVGMAVLTIDPAGKPSSLSARETFVVRRHVELGVALLQDTGDTDSDVLAVVRSHHERHDGSGYPEGLRGHEIPLMARLAGLVDAYDAMITPRAHAPDKTSFEAMRELWQSQEQLFQRELIEQFIQAIGLFPTGSLVELSNGEVGIVVAQNEMRRLAPKVALVLDAAKSRYDQFVVVDLAEDARDLRIDAELREGAYGVYADEFFL